MNTIVAISSGLTKNAISIIRLSGEDSLSIIKKLLEPKCNTNTDSTIMRPLIPRKASLRCIYDTQGRMLDKAILIYFQAPYSFNGEDIIEIQSHGGIVLAQEILKTCLAYGATLAKPGEFSKRALLNGKLDMLELEATLALINNTNTNLTELLMRNLNGKCSKMLESVRLQILEIIAQIEVNIDYSEEDLDSNIIEHSMNILHDIISKFQAILESTKHYNKLQHIKLCILGKPNVGKSALLNLLLLQDRAIVSDIAGTTRDTITETIDIHGNLVSIADTAGIRTSDNDIEMQGIQRSFEYAKNSEIILCVFDISSKITSEDREILDFIHCNCNDKFVLIVLNKDDLESQIDYDFSCFNTIQINTKDIRNSQRIKQKINEFLTMEIHHDTLILTSNLQSNLLESAWHNLIHAKELLLRGELELSSYELTQSLQFLGQIIKPYDVEEMLDSMFSQFCVGK